MVYVQSIKSYLQDADVMALCHLDYALKVTGGALRDGTTGVTGLANDERLHITGHGGKGSIVGMTVQDIAQRLQADIPRQLSASVLITTCYAGSSSGGFGLNPDGSQAVQYDSVLKQLARSLRGWTGLTLYGYRGPTITNAYMDPKIGFVPDEKVEDAGNLQGHLLGGQFRTPFILATQVHDAWFQTHQHRNAAWFLANCAGHVDAIAQRARDFYQRFYQVLKFRQLLGTEQEQLASVDILA